MSGKRVWLVRVAQEFTIEASSADDALAFVRKLERRKVKHATLLDARSVLAAIVAPRA